MTVQVEKLDSALGPFREAQKMLEYVEASALNRQIDLPSRRYVTQGQAVHECEQVASTMLVSQTGLPGQVGGPGPGVILNCPVPWQIVVEVAIVRCQGAVPGNEGEPPTAEALLADAEVVSKDTCILQDAADSRVAEGFGGVSCAITYPAPSGLFIVTSARYAIAISS